MGQMIPAQSDAHATTFLPPRDEYAQITDLATRLAGTAFVPSDLKSDPPAVLAAMLTGRELGLAPMESLRSIHMIEGRPTLSAEATMKLAQEAGNLLIVTETTRERATVKYRNASWPEDEPARTLTFDLEDADLAGLKGRAMWRKYPRAMLRSRAITEAARAGGLLSGAALAYTAEEMTDDRDVDDGTVEEAVVVESISPDTDDEDELEARRSLHKRAAAAYKRAAAADEAAAGTAWTAFGAGLSDTLWTDTDLATLTIRVEDLERIAEQLAAEHPDDEEDEEDDGGEPAPEPEPEPGSDDGAEDEPEPEPTDEEPSSEAETMSPEAQPVPPPAEQSEEALLAERYPALNVSDLSALLRKGQADVEGTTLVLPRHGVGGALAAYEQIERLEREHHDPPRKTVLAALESAGWTPKGRKRLEAARQRAQMDEDGDAAMAGPEEVRAAQSASESRHVEDLLDDFEQLLGALEGEARHRARLKLGEIIAASEDGVPDQTALAALVDEMDADASW